MAEPVPRKPNPTVAAFLGFLPGVGAAYNGQYEKGVLHVLMLPMLVGMIEADEIFAFLMPAYIAYMVVDAYKTAAARTRNEPSPDYLRLRELLGSADKPLSAAFGLDTGERVAVDPADDARLPMGAIVLIVLGTLLLFANMGWIPRRPFGTFWPLILVVVGVVQGRRRLRAHQ
jgi:hypothetical protein